MRFQCHSLTYVWRIEETESFQTQLSKLC